MVTYNFAVPSFHVAEIRSAGSDTLFASTSLRVTNANGSLHKNWGSKGAALNDRKAGGDVDLSLSWDDVDVPDPTPENPDGGAVSWVFLLVNAGHQDHDYVTVLNKAADAFAGALAGKVIDPGNAGGVGSLAFLAGFGTVLAAQEALNLLTANCDGQVASGAFELTAAQLASMAPSPGRVWSTSQDNPGSESAHGCGANSDYVVKYEIQRQMGKGLFPGVTVVPSRRRTALETSFAICPTPGIVEVFWVRPDGMVFTNGRASDINNGNWNNPVPIAPNPGAADPRSGVAAVCPTPGIVEVFWVRPDGMVFTNGRDPDINNGNWNNPVPIAPNSGSADPRSGVAAVCPAPGIVEVFWVRPDGMVFTNGRASDINNGNWNNPVPIAPNPGSAAIRNV